MGPTSRAERRAVAAGVTVPVARTPFGYRLGKRALDVGASSLILLVASPALLLIAAAVRLESHGPILFRQQRVGLGGRSFTLFKFRSMDAAADEAEHRAYVSRLIRRDTVDAEDDHDGTWRPISDDARVTRIGAFLRRSHLDELPQLFNILRGDMSLVGPRPPIPYEVELYEPWQLARLSVVPGLTGLWQATAWGRVSFEEGVALDLEYVKRRSLWLDLRLLSQTAWQIVAGRQF
jgi:lipopolysaccharide/colanic/teichoic acid biosynthesis glycosyltransferase